MPPTISSSRERRLSPAQRTAAEILPVGDRTRGKAAVDLVDLLLRERRKVLRRDLHQVRAGERKFVLDSSEVQPETLVGLSGSVIERSTVGAKGMSSEVGCAIPGPGSSRQATCAVRAAAPGTIDRALVWSRSYSVARKAMSARYINIGQVLAEGGTPASLRSLVRWSNKPE